MLTRETLEKMKGRQVELIKHPNEVTGRGKLKDVLEDGVVLEVGGKEQIIGRNLIDSIKEVDS